MQRREFDALVRKSDMILVEEITKVRGGLKIILVEVVKRDMLIKKVTKNIKSSFGPKLLIYMEEIESMMLDMLE